MATDGPTLGLLDRGLYALFAHHANDEGHATTRERYRAANPDTGFDLYVARVYGLAWFALVTGTFVTGTVALALPAGTFDRAVSLLARSLPVLDRLTLPTAPRVAVALSVALLAGVGLRSLVFVAGNRYLAWVAAARRADIAATLPGAVRYLRVLASGTHDRRAMLRAVAQQNAYGETAVAFRRALNHGTLTGSLDAGLERVASETPSRDLLAPFLLKFREHANQSADALEGYLEMEGRLLSHEQSRRHERATGYLELLAELFVVLLVVPALVVLIVTVMGVLAPGLSRPVATPVGAVSVRSGIVYGSAAFVLATGLLASFVVTTLRPRNTSAPSYERPSGVLATLRTIPSNPASTLTVCLPAGGVLAVGCWLLGYRPVNVLLLSYVGVGLPVGAVAVRRARRDDAKDREIQDFVHAVAGHVALGRPFPESVRRVADDVQLGALAEDVESLAFTLSLGDSPTEAADDRRAAALDQFVDRVGTPMAEQTIGLVVGALDAGSDAEDVFETLQTEIGKLYHQRKSLRAALIVYVAVGWTTALLVVGITVAVNVYVLSEFAQLSSVASGQTVAFDPSVIDPERERYRFYVVTQATMLACGWFAGTASRGFYEALLHSSALVLAAYVVFAGVGLL
ncbi:type II secretion system F family protein [Halomicroarcula sp. S1AR25-4]|uniref:type II secretion system F family protein n=1 Tax=Haloarcula sp. S1AR25-4 TaxID=2950538 RepID=UPI0028752D3D|nr:type II secretion system F family protein [Halomicroarcula sp. S1AR25-4]MDS0277580.1 type II secretion system F family protein [Halomicroarcula sp. S1AR25-4]